MKHQLWLTYYKSCDHHQLQRHSVMVFFHPENNQKVSTNVLWKGNYNLKSFSILKICSFLWSRILISYKVTFISYIIIGIFAKQNSQLKHCEQLKYNVFRWDYNTKLLFQLYCLCWIKIMSLWYCLSSIFVSVQPLCCICISSTFMLYLYHMNLDVVFVSAQLNHVSVI